MTTDRAGESEVWVASADGQISMRTPSVTNGAETFDVVVVERTEVADKIVALTVKAAHGGELPRFNAGAHVDVHVTPGITRQYSLCSDPAKPDHYRLAMLLEKDSRGGSAGVHRTFRVGHKFAISHPRNNFALVETAQRSLLIAGGIGVTPIIAMAYRLHAMRANFALHYCARAHSSAAFVDELVTSPFGQNVIMHYDDGPLENRFEADAIQSRGPDTHAYVCGPLGFIEHVTQGLQRRGWPDAAIHIERFTAEIDLSGDSFTVVASLSGRRFVVPAEASIAQILKGNGINVEVSCEQGVCGTCLTRVLEGIPDHRDLYQTDREKAANTYITLCCSRSKTPELVLEI